jgi:hypothetical protein
MKKITLARIKRKIIRMFFREQWTPVLRALDGSFLKIIAPPEDRFWADPFIVENNGKKYLFVEQQIGFENGTLGVIEIFPDLTYSEFVPILEKNYHLSFPNVFHFENNWYLIPETHENKTIDLYKAADFPYKWKYETALMKNITAADSTVFYHQNKWWLFTSISLENNSLNNNLHIFYSDYFPSDKWTAHPENPVVSGLKNSRMAGAVFVRDGKIYRPAQDCVKDYGQKTNINEIIELTPESYREKTIKIMYPEKELDAVCTHHIAYSDHFMVRDVKIRRMKKIRR